MAEILTRDGVATNVTYLPRRRRIEQNPFYYVPLRIVDAITAFLRRTAFTTIHYLGYTDADLLSSLNAEGRYSLSMMDYWGRHCRAARLPDQGNLFPDLVVADWMDEIPSYAEGAPRHQVLLQDIPWQGDQLDRLTPPRRQPRCIVLFGDAQLGTLHHAYKWWDEFPSIRIGLRRRQEGANPRAT